MDNQTHTFQKRVKISGKIIFDSAFHIGSGREGILATDMGVLLDERDRPILPGSTLKGLFRTTAERLAPHLDLTACLLDSSLSGVNCITEESYRKQQHETFKKLETEKLKLEWLSEHVCDVCTLFGSPYKGSRIYFSDGTLVTGGDSIQIRDGVCIDRDSGTARHGLKYDFEVASSETEYTTFIDLENPTVEELALVGAVIAEWELGLRVGGFTSRGLGVARLTDVLIKSVDYSDREQLKNYLLKKEMIVAPRLLQEAINIQLSGKGAAHA